MKFTLCVSVNLYVSLGVVKLSVSHYVPPNNYTV